MLEFAWWWILFALPLPLLIRWLTPAVTETDSAALKVPSLMPHVTAPEKLKQNHRFILLVSSLIWITLIIAAAQPRWLGEPVSIPSKGRELMLAVDLSGSMKIDDMQLNGQQVNRLTMIKAVLNNFIQRRVGDRLGLILFADTAYMQAPLTYDRETVASLLNEAVIGLIGEQTAIGDAIGLAVKRFDEKEDTNRVIILLTDGQNTAGNITPAQAKELAVASNTTVYTIGVGADEMLIQNFFGSRRVNPSQDLDETMLRDLAESTGGQYFRARDAQELNNIYAILDELEPVEGDERKMRPLTALYYYPLALALVLSVLTALVVLGRNYWRQRRVNFKEMTEN
ncbi:vWA domain-containing protein [Alteromonas sp. ASW11-130]|uniref:vWA domain-containing protein n=1 Tax=Alteromonas sp. ASW11-130 TaxID=3015775 RepID=UPI002242520B|nr:VWA domain-containing protein [Alteromonas sp. ASW11-130]MCW8093050.1 VWA domain-containing protein [Alteromonas sp. ASW11-130]